ncbi:TPA: preprotein translocase subunit SecE [Enterococcus faecium]
MNIYLKKIVKETKRISWLSISQTTNETVKIVIFSIVCVLFLGFINWLLQNGLHNLLTL